MTTAYVVGAVAVRLASLALAVAAALLLTALLEPVVCGLSRPRVPRAVGSVIAVIGGRRGERSDRAALGPGRGRAA